jgi:hypothetical protein
VSLALRLVFNNTTHEIMLGAVGIPTRLRSERRVNVFEFGAIADGGSHPLSERYSSLQSAWADYPHATSLADEVDWAAIQAAIESVTPTGGAVELCRGTYRIADSIPCPQT